MVVPPHQVGRYLLEQGSVAENGLFGALVNGSVECVALLLEFGGSPDDPPPARRERGGHTLRACVPTLHDAAMR